MSRTAETAHAYARRQGVSRPLYSVARVLATLVLRTSFRLRIRGEENVPREGSALIAPNHKNFLDPFFVGLALSRPVHYMAKTELIEGPFGGLLMRLGAFPVRRGESDAEAIRTAREILRAGGIVVMFPEGTRVEEPDALGSPRHGVGRLALETGAPIIPAAISGTSHLWRGALPKLKRVQITFLDPVSPESAAGDAGVSELIDERVWPAVQEEVGRQRATPGLILAGLAAAGIGGGLLARRRLESRRQPRLLGKLEPRKLRRKQKREVSIRRLRPRRRRAGRLRRLRPPRR